jgi:hypothetical protein
MKPFSPRYALFAAAIALKGPRTVTFLAHADAQIRIVENNIVNVRFFPDEELKTLLVIDIDYEQRLSDFIGNAANAIFGLGVQGDLLIDIILGFTAL